MFFSNKGKEARLKRLAREAELKAALDGMDLFFSQRPWGTLSVSAGLAEGMGAFTEDAVSPDDFFTAQEEEMADILGSE
jgi:hypothetical protein